MQNNAHMPNFNPFGQVWSAQQPQQWGNTPTPKYSYSTEELLQIWSSLQQRLQDEGYEEKYKSLEPIRELVKQVEHDRSAQATTTQGGSKATQPQRRTESNEVEQLTAKMNELDEWAKTENNGLDFASILNNVVSARQTQQTQSPFLSNASFHSTPSLLQPQPQVQNVEWFYVDPNGNEQGPFASQQMQDWHHGGYFNPELKVRRSDESTYQTLSELQFKVSNMQQPFLAPYPSASHSQFQQQQQPSHFAHLYQQQQQQQQQFSPFDQQIPGLFEQPQSPFMAHPQAQHSQLNSLQQQQQSSWNLANSGRNSPWSAHAIQNDFLQSNLIPNVFANGTTVGTPSANNSTLATTAPETTIATAEITNDDVLNEVQSHVVGEVLQEPNPVEESVAVVPEPVAPVVEDVQEVKKEVKPKKQPSKPTKVTTTTETQQKEAKAAPPAPWAKQATDYQTPQLTLEQIQQQEAQEKERQMKLRAQQAAAFAQIQASNAAQAQAQLQTEQKRPGLPSNASWATVGKVETPTKTLADIQREEAEAMKRASATATAPAPAKTSFASIVNNSVPSSPWTTVTSKKPTPKPQSHTPIIHSTKAVTPDVLRQVSATSITTTTTTTTTYTTSTKVSPRQEFLQWCRQTLKLNKGVKTDDVLQIMLMLPIGSESGEIIADTIYSNSSTMDGRRFAQEFMKRRKAVEDQVKDGLTWNDALHIAAGEDDDGWDFQVVKKKGKRRN